MMQYSLRMSLQSALIGYLIPKLFPTPMIPQENVVLQTIAVAIGTVCLHSSPPLLPADETPDCSSGASTTSDACTQQIGCIICID